MHKVIIFGNSGFIGDYVYNNFSKDFEVIGYNSKECNLLNINNIEDKLKQFQEPLILIMVSSITRIKENTFNSYEKNVQMAYNLSEVVNNLTNIQQILFLSSIDVYGTDSEDKQINEKTLSHPSDFYAISKLTSELILKKVCKEKNISLTILRLPGVYGKNEQISTIGKMIHNARNGKIVIYGDGKDKRDFLYIQDFLYILFCCIQQNISDTINIVSGKSFTINDIGKELYNKFNNSKIEYRKEESITRNKSLIFDNKKLSKIIPEYNMKLVIDFIKLL